MKASKLIRDHGVLITAACIHAWWWIGQAQKPKLEGKPAPVASLICADEVLMVAQQGGASVVIRAQYESVTLVHCWSFHP